MYLHRRLGYLGYQEVNGLYRELILVCLINRKFSVCLYQSLGVRVESLILL